MQNDCNVSSDSDEEYRADSDFEYESPFATEEEMAAAAQLATKNTFSSVKRIGEHDKKASKVVKRNPSAYTLFVKDFVRQHWKSRNKQLKSDSKSEAKNQEVEEKLILRAARAWRECDPDIKETYLKQSRSGKVQKERNAKKITKRNKSEKVVKSGSGDRCETLTATTVKSDHVAQIGSFELSKKKPPTSAYMAFVRAQAEKGCGVRMSEQHKAIASKWQTMSEADKKPFLDQARREKEDQKAEAAASANLPRPQRQRSKVSYRKLNSGI